MRENDAAVFNYRHNRAVETPLFDGTRCSLLAFQRKRVELLASEALHRRDRIGSQTLVGLWITLLQTRIGRAQPGHPQARLHVRPNFGIDHRHHFATAGDQQILHPGPDLTRCEADSCQATAAKAIERDTADTLVVTGIECSHATHVAALQAALKTRPPDHIIDISGIEFVAHLQRSQHGRRQVLRVQTR